MVDHRRHRHLRALSAAIAVLVGAGSGLGACASGGRQVKRDDYRSRVEARVKVARESAKFRVRVNPSACECPPFEIDLGGVWQRVEMVGFEAEDPIGVRLDELVQGRDQRVVAVEGKLEEVLGLCARGALYVSLVPTALDAELPGEVRPAGGGVGPDSSERR